MHIVCNIFFFRNDTQTTRLVSLREHIWWQSEVEDEEEQSLQTKKAKEELEQLNMQRQGAEVCTHTTPVIQ